MTKNKKPVKSRVSRTASVKRTKNKAVVKPKSLLRRIEFHVALVLLVVLVAGAVFAYKSMTAHADASGILWQASTGGVDYPYQAPSNGTITVSVAYSGVPTGHAGLLILYEAPGTSTLVQLSQSSYSNPVNITFNIDHNASYYFDVDSMEGTASFTLSYSLTTNTQTPTTTEFRSMPCSYTPTYSLAGYGHPSPPCASPTPTPTPTPGGSTGTTSSPAPTPSGSSSGTTTPQGPSSRQPSSTDTTAPSTPTGLTATAKGSDGVDLSWKASTDSDSSVSGYQIYRGTGTSNMQLIKYVGQTSFSDINLNPQTTYYYQIKAYDAANNISGPSVIVSATTGTISQSFAPTVAISNPHDGSTVSGIVGIDGIAGNGTPPITSVQIEVDNDGFVSASLNAVNSNDVNFDYSLNTLLYADTQHTITAKTTDSKGATNSTSIKLTFKNGDYPKDPPLAQGTWVSPEGMTVHVDSKGKNPHTGQSWTIADAYYMVTACATGTGDFGKIAPYYTVNIIDNVGNAAPAQAYTVVGVGTGLNGNWSNFGATSELNGSQDPMLTEPYDVVCYEYGHAWTNYYYYMVNYPTAADNLHDSGMTAPPNYLAARWVNKNGSITLAQNNYCDQSVDGWDGCMTDDRRMLFGGAGTNGGDDTADRVPGEPNTGYREPHVGYINSLIIPPQEQPGLADWYAKHWMTGT